MTLSAHEHTHVRTIFLFWLFCCVTTLELIHIFIRTTLHGWSEQFYLSHGLRCRKRKDPNLTSTLDDWLWLNMVIKRWASWNRTVKRISVFQTVLGEIFFSRRHVWKTITSHRNKKLHASLPIIARVEQYLAKHPHTHSVTHSHARIPPKLATPHNRKS